MARIQPVDPASASYSVKLLLDSIASDQRGAIPNVFKIMARSRVALRGYLSCSDALNSGALDPIFREQIGLAVAQANGSEYGLSMHASTAQKLALSEAEIAASRRAASKDAKKDAGLKFVRDLVVLRGQIDDRIFQDVRDAGYTDAEIVEIVATVALDIFTDYLNHVAKAKLDFPQVSTSIK